VEAAFWNDLERHIIAWGAQPDGYLLCRRDLRPNRHKAGEKFITEYRDQPDGRPRPAQVVVQVPTAGGDRRRGRHPWPQDAHGAHTAGQSVLDRTGT
jgi:hypothetical protein